MGEITTIGLDLAKNAFHVIGCNVHGKEVKRKMLRRSQVMAYFANLPPCLIGMEACSGAHFWARRFEELGHEVRLIAPQHVKAYVRGNKNDYNDARAIAEAVCRPDMRFVAVKTVEEQDVQALHRLREAQVGERTALCNQIRGLLAEYGIVLPKGVGVVRKRLPELLEEGDLDVRLYVMYLVPDAGELLDDYIKTPPEIGLGDHRLTLRSIKIFADGALGARGAALLEPYSDDPGTRPCHGAFGPHQRVLAAGYDSSVEEKSDRLVDLSHETPRRTH